MDLVALKAELTAGQPGSGAYDADDATAAAQLNVVNRTLPRASLTGSEVLNAVDTTEWLALDDARRQQVWDIVHLGTVNPFGVEATLMTAIFPAAESPTIAALAEARQRPVSRGVERGFGFVGHADVEDARAL
jgi:hypothetical protein